MALSSTSAPPQQQLQQLLPSMIASSISKERRKEDEETQQPQERIVQLGYCLRIENEEQLQMVAHRSYNYMEWDGGQVGGVPIWLNPQHIPMEPLLCLACHHPNPLRFLCQLYAPIDNKDEMYNHTDPTANQQAHARAYHRSLYVFGCPYCPEQIIGSIRVLRVQLPKQNDYYPIQHDIDDDLDEELDEIEEVDWKQHEPDSWDVPICALCGVRGTGGKCPVQQLYFCSKLHQKEYKKFIFDHQQNNNNIRTLKDNAVIPYLPSVYPTHELVVEEEPPMASKKPQIAMKQVRDDSQSKASAPPTDVAIIDKEIDVNYTSDSNENVDPDQNLNQNDLNEMIGIEQNQQHNQNKSISHDPVTMHFFHRIQERPNTRDQCLRYCRWPTPSKSITQQPEPEHDITVEVDERNLQQETNNEPMKENNYGSWNNNLASKDDGGGDEGHNNADDDNELQTDVPLWIRTDHRPLPNQIPPCPYCHAARQYEFQLMPQMLNYLLQGRSVSSPSSLLSKKNETDTMTEMRTTNHHQYSARAALEQTESLMQMLPPEHIPPGLVDAKKALVQRIQDELQLGGRTVRIDSASDPRSHANPNNNNNNRNEGAKRNHDTSSRVDIDWGVVVVYTCTNSCDGAKYGDDEGDQIKNPTSTELHYFEEFAWKQPSLDVL